jgi:hypothetical protein
VDEADELNGAKRGELVMMMHGRKNVVSLW